MARTAVIHYLPGALEFATPWAAACGASLPPLSPGNTTDRGRVNCRRCRGGFWWKADLTWALSPLKGKTHA